MTCSSLQSISQKNLLCLNVEFGLERTSQVAFTVVWFYARVTWVGYQATRGPHSSYRWPTTRPVQGIPAKFLVPICVADVRVHYPLSVMLHFVTGKNSD